MYATILANGGRAIVFWLRHMDLPQRCGNVNERQRKWNKNECPPRHLADPPRMPAIGRFRPMAPLSSVTRLQPRRQLLRREPVGLGQARSRFVQQPKALSDVVPLLQPGSFVRLRDHPEDLPPFQLIQCQGGRCWVRQQAWGGLVQWEVARRSLTSAA